MSRRKLTLEQLSLFSGNLATCIAAGLDIPRSLTTCQRSAPSPVLREILTEAAKQAAVGMSLFDALKPHSTPFPAFSCPRPLRRRGWAVGRNAALSRKPLPPAHRAGKDHVQQWFAPLCLLLTDTVICTVAYCLFGPRTMTIAYVFDWLRFYAILVAAVAAVIYVPPLRVGGYRQASRARRRTG